MPATRSDEPCTFCLITRSQDTSYTIFEDRVSLAFLDHRPLFPGHTLLIPKEHYETLIDLPPTLVGPLFANAQLIARLWRLVSGLRVRLSPSTIASARASLTFTFILFRGGEKTV